MKFYYNGKLLRTSATHHYTHACFNKETEQLVSCSSTMEGALREKTSRINNYRKSIESTKLMLKAKQQGKKTVVLTHNRRSYTAKVDGTVEDYKNAIRQMEDQIRYFEENYIIVELEERP